jgi:hypothetical protein
MDNNNNFDTQSFLDMDIRPPYSMDVRTEGSSSDIIATGIATAIILGGIGLSMAISKSREWLERS